MNTITVMGNVGREPELRFAQSGKAVAKFSVADTRGKDDGKETIWHNVVCFDEMAENVCEEVKKGARVLVQGRLSVSKYMDKEGVERVAHEIVADEIAISLRWKRKDTTSRLVREFDGVEEDPF